MQGRCAAPGHGVRERERARERKKERKRGRETETERRREAREASARPPPNDAAEVRAAEPTPIFVCGAARTHAVHFPAGAALGDLRAGQESRAGRVLDRGR